MSPRVIHRCASCRSAKGAAHKPFCRRHDRKRYPDGITYIPSTESGYGDTGSNNTPTDSNSDGGGGGCE